MPDEKKLYHLADGVIVSIGPVNTSLVDLVRDTEVDIEFRHIDAVEKVALGEWVPGYEALIPGLLEEGVLAEGPPIADPVIQRRLERLDRIYLGQYEDRLSERVHHIYERILDAHARRKRFFERVGQCPVLPETALRRALLVGDAKEVGVKKVLCLGDDDLLSVALAMLGHEVTAYDIDDYLLSFLKIICEQQGLDVTIAERDLRDPLEDAELEQFDVFLTDPMSNRDCLEIFLSRAFSMLKPGGVGFSAVYAPVGRLFRQIADEMKFPIERWLARHNHYYSKYFNLHSYESDWVQIRKTPETIIKHPPGEFSVPLNLYREDYHQRNRSMVSFYDDIEDVEHALPMFLEMVFDGVEALLRESSNLPENFAVLDRIMHPEEDWTVIHLPTTTGYVTLHVDRPRRQLTLDMHPFVPELEEQLRTLLIAAYKTTATESSVSINRACWDLRVR